MNWVSPRTAWCYDSYMFAKRPSGKVRGPTINLMLRADHARGVLHILVGHEAKAPRLASVPILHDHRLLERPELREVCLRRPDIVLEQYSSHIVALKSDDL